MQDFPGLKAACSGISIASMDGARWFKMRRLKSLYVWQRMEIGASRIFTGLQLRYYFCFSPYLCNFVGDHAFIEYLKVPREGNCAQVLNLLNEDAVEVCRLVSMSLIDASN